MKSKYYTLEEEIAHGVTHGFGILLCVIGIPILLSLAVKNGNLNYIVGFSIYSLSLLMVYVSSTLYHSIAHEKVKYIMRMIDHICIFVMIAGSYTPFLLVYFSDSFGWQVLFLMWGIVLAGTIFKIFFLGRFKYLSVVLYLAMGFVAIFFAADILEKMPTETVIWLCVGGGFYSTGVIFYLWDKLLYNHAIWHLFVLGGSISHYIALLYSL